MKDFRPWLSGIRGPKVRANHDTAWDNKRAQNGPGNAVVAHRPGPDLSASLTTDEEH